MASMASTATSIPLQRGGERRWGGGLFGEEECEVEDREWSVAKVAAAANANPRLGGGS